MPLPQKEFSIKSWTDEIHLVLQPCGPLHWDEGEKLREYLDNCELRDLVIIDLADVDSMSSGGLATLIYIHSTLQARGKRLRIRCPRDRIRDVLKIAHLDRLLDIQTCN